MGFLFAAVPHLQQEEIDREETLADLEGGQVQEEGLEDLIAALRQRNNAAAAAAASQQQQQHAADDSGLFWDYTGNSSSSRVPPPPPQQQQQQPVPLPRAALANAAAAAQPRAAAPQAIAPPVVAGPWARAATSGAIKAPPPGSTPQQPQQRSAASVVAAGGRSAAVKSSVPGAVYASDSAAAAAAAPSRRPAAAAASNGSSSMGFTDGSGGDSSMGMLPGGLQLSPAFAEWCRGQMLLLNGNADMDMIEVLMGLTSNSEIAECCQVVWQGKPGESCLGFLRPLFCRSQELLRSRFERLLAFWLMLLHEKELARCGRCCCRVLPGGVAGQGRPEWFRLLVACSFFVHACATLGFSCFQ
jgi:hypothetical protein